MDAAPAQSLRASAAGEADQLETLAAYVREGVEAELQAHNALRAPMLLAFSPRGANAVRAMCQLAGAGSQAPAARDRQVQHVRRGAAGGRGAQEGGLPRAGRPRGGPRARDEVGGVSGGRGGRWGGDAGGLSVTELPI